MSIILAKILGLCFLGIGLAFMISPDRLRKIYPQAMKDENFLMFGSLFALLIGAVIVSIHNVFILGWQVIITLLGWWSLIKGFALLVYPNFITYASSFQNRSNMFYRAISFFYLVLGTFLLYNGFFKN